MHQCVVMMWSRRWHFLASTTVALFFDGPSSFVFLVMTISNILKLLLRMLMMADLLIFVTDWSVVIHAITTFRQVEDRTSAWSCIKISFYSFVSLRMSTNQIFCRWREIFRRCKPINQILLLLNLPLCWGWSRALASSVELVFSDSDRSSFNL